MWIGACPHVCPPRPAFAHVRPIRPQSGCSIPSASQWTRLTGPKPHPVLPKLVNGRYGFAGYQDATDQVGLRWGHLGRGTESSLHRPPLGQRGRR
jgi:hypothetical protein